MTGWLTGNVSELVIDWVTVVDCSQWINKDVQSASTLAHQDNGKVSRRDSSLGSLSRCTGSESYRTCREMSLICTSSVLHFPKSLISGDSATAGAVSHVSVVTRRKTSQYMENYCMFFICDARFDIQTTSNHPSSDSQSHYWGRLTWVIQLNSPT